MRSTRRASTLFETMIACAVLGVALTLTARLSSMAHAHSEAAERRAAAAQEAANLMERIAAMPYERLTAAGVGELTLSPMAVDALPEGSLSIDVDEVDGEVLARRVMIEIRWRNRAGQNDAPVRLAAWFYPTAQEQSP